MLRYESILIIAAFLALSTAAEAQSKHAFEKARNRMVDEEVVAAGVKDPRVIGAMRSTPRHEFVSLRKRKYAYYDMALPIGEGQTISPPFVVAYMTEQLDPQPSDKVLEIGTGSGYQAAVLSPLVDRVYTIEIVESLGRKAARALKRLKYANVDVKVGDGYQGWPEHAPFDKIIVTCSPERVPLPLVEQLREGGLMIVPVGERYRQTLYLLTKKDGQLVSKALRPTLFVPMTGVAERRRQLLPDPRHPRLENGSFEQLTGDSGRPLAWHYLRQAELIANPKEARHGKHYLSFTSQDSGRGSQALQGFAIDGRAVNELEISLSVRGQNLRYGQHRRQAPGLLVTFYDADRATVAERGLGPWLGTFSWQREQARVAVPTEAREAILRIGLLGGIGELAVDDVEVRAQGKTAKGKRKKVKGRSE